MIYAFFVVGTCTALPFVLRSKSLFVKGTLVFLAFLVFFPQYYGSYALFPLPYLLVHVCKGLEKSYWYDSSFLFGLGYHVFNGFAELFPFWVASVSNISIPMMVLFQFLFNVAMMCWLGFKPDRAS